MIKGILVAGTAVVVGGAMMVGFTTGVALTAVSAMVFNNQCNKMDKEFDDFCKRSNKEFKEFSKKVDKEFDDFKKEAGL